MMGEEASKPGSIRSKTIVFASLVCLWNHSTHDGWHLQRISTEISLSLFLSFSLYIYLFRSIYIIEL